MKQYILSPSSPEAVTKRLKSLLDGGASWFTLSMPGAPDDAIADTIRAAIEICRPAEAIFVVEGHPELALNTVVDDVRASGVLIDASHGDPAAIREQLGPHAIIGYAAATPGEILALHKLDIDYFTLPADAMTAELEAVATPIVATGATELPAGFAAIAVSADE